MFARYAGTAPDPRAAARHTSAHGMWVGKWHTIRRQDVTTRTAILSNMSRSLPTVERAALVLRRRQRSSWNRTNAADAIRTRNWFATNLQHLVRSIPRSCLSSLMRFYESPRPQYHRYRFSEPIRVRFVMTKRSLSFSDRPG